MSRQPHSDEMLMRKWAVFRDRYTQLYRAGLRHARASGFMDSFPGSEHVPYNRINAVLEKWGRKGWWDCGVTVRSGWLTDEGRKAFEPNAYPLPARSPA